MTPLQFATMYHDRGWAPLPIPFRTKKPTLERWPEFRPKREELQKYFNGHPQNIGILMGAPSGGLVDIDVDAKEAVRIASTFLPKTGAVFGRAGKPRSHWLYIVQPIPELVRLREKSDDDTSTIIEIRSTGGQTIFPGSVHVSGEPIEWATEAIEPASIDEAALTIAVNKLAAAALIARHWKEGLRNDASLALAGGLLRAGWNEEDTTEFLGAVTAAALDDEDRESAVALTAEKLRGDEEVTGWRRLGELIGKEAVDKVTKWLGIRQEAGRAQHVASLNTDIGNAARFVNQHGGRLRYSFGGDKWYAWDGRRWRPDDAGEVLTLAKQTALSIFDQARNADSDSRREELGKHAVRSQKRERIAAMVALARPDVAVKPGQLDADPWRLNCLNGTVDLRTGELRPHDPADQITRLAPVEYNPDARHPVWERLLNDATGGNADVIAFLQRAVGYSLTGDVSEEVLFFIHGPGAAGKSTFVEAVKAALGDYATTADFETFLERKGTTGPRNDIARLDGARFVTSVEVSDGRYLAQGLVKMLTGGDTVAARMLYRESFEFVPQFKLWLAANHAPRVDDRDDALWRRIIRIPFDRAVPKEKRDPSIKATLKSDPAARAAVLAWAVAGCRSWQAVRLGVPDCLQRATDEYRAEQDPLRDFLRERCILGAGYEADAGPLRRAYMAYAEEIGLRRLLSPRDFAERLREHGCEDDKGGKGRRKWYGIGLLAPVDEE